MKRSTFAALAAIALLVGVLAMPRPAHAAPSTQLGNVLAEMRGLSYSDFTALATWARNGAPAPFFSSFQPQATQGDILKLDGPDRRAVLSWLQGNGRSALYARGASDSDIGSRDPTSGPVATPTPNPWRNVPLASSSLEGNVQGAIDVIGGFAAARRDGTAAIACVSFKNVAPKTATRVVFEIPLLNDAGQELGKLTIDRSGEFSSNIDIMSYASLSDWQGNSIGPRSRMDNCIQRTLPTAAMPILEARVAGYRVVRVVYADGSSWPGATP